MTKIFIVILCFILSLTACTIRSKNNTDGTVVSGEDSLCAKSKERDIHDSLLIESFKYINSVKGHKEELFLLIVV